MIKKIIPYFLIVVLCIVGYIMQMHFEKTIIVQKKLSYTTPSASEVFLVWGLIKGPLPPKKLWPQNSYEENNLVYTKLTRNNHTFFTVLALPHATEIYYWMVQMKDSAGNTTEVWDTGDENKKSYTAIFEEKQIFRSGYFIFLAGMLPLALFYFKQRNQKRKIPVYNPGINAYVPQLDSIRAIAVLLVIFHHWLPEKSLINFLHNGAIGVDTFFVLSGFLITSILLKSKEDLERKNISTATVFKNFYIRRSLRIFPIYYLLLIIFWLFNDPEILKNGIYYYTYTSNILFYDQQSFVARFAHLWSLAVEEQFYLIWPFLIIFVAKNRLPFVIGIFLTIGISANYIITAKGWWVNIFTPACFDAFAIGAMLSFTSGYRQDIIKYLQKKFNAILLFACCLLFTDILLLHALPPRTIHSIFAVILVFYSLYLNNNRIANIILNHKWLQSMGRISYGIYLYHLFIPELWSYVIKYCAEHNVDLLYNRSIPGNLKITWLFLQHFTIVILLSKLSWYLIEKPVNQLKERFTGKPG
ncbi:MAG: acyltransferase [Ferruginibacter sp.]